MLRFWEHESADDIALAVYRQVRPDATMTRSPRA